MRPITANVGPLAAASANNIALSQTPGAAGNLTLNGSTVTKGVSTLDNPRRVLITTADTTHNFTVNGTTPTGSQLTETLKAVAGSGFTAQDFATVTSISIDGAATGAVTVGTNGIASTPWVRLDEWCGMAVSLQCDVTGTVNYTVQQSNDDPNDPTFPVLPSAMTWIPSNDANVVGASTSQLSNYLIKGLWVRALLNSGTGSVSMRVSDIGVVNL